MKPVVMMNEPIIKKKKDRVLLLKEKNNIAIIAIMWVINVHTMENTNTHTQK